MPYIKLEDLQKFPIRKDHYDKVHGNEHFVNGVETVLEYAEYLPTYDVAPKSEVAREIITEIADSCKGEDFKNIDFAIGYISAMNKVLAKLAEIKRRYTEGA